MEPSKQENIKNIVDIEMKQAIIKANSLGKAAFKEGRGRWGHECKEFAQLLAELDSGDDIGNLVAGDALFSAYRKAWQEAFDA